MAGCSVRDQRMRPKPQLFSFYPDAFNSFVNLSRVPLSHGAVTLIPFLVVACMCVPICRERIAVLAYLTADYGQCMIRGAQGSCTSSYSLLCP